MKRTTIIQACLCVGMLIAGATQCLAQKIKVGDATYVINGNEATLTDYKKAVGDIVIPSEVSKPKNAEKYAVVAIGNKAFLRSNITSVDIPETVKSLGDDCFREARSLKTVKLPASITKIPSLAFAYCESLESIDLSGITEFEGLAFKGCTNLSKVNFNNELTEVGYNCFESTGITELTIPTTITSIGNSAFNNCSKLEKLIIEDSTDTLTVNVGAFDNTPIKSLYLGRECKFYKRFRENPAYDYFNFEDLTEITYGPCLSRIPERTTGHSLKTMVIDIEDYNNSDELYNYIFNYRYYEPNRNDATLVERKNFTLVFPDGTTLNSEEKDSKAFYTYFTRTKYKKNYEEALENKDMEISAWYSRYYNFDLKEDTVYNIKLIDLLGEKIDDLTPEEQAQNFDPISKIASNYRYLKHYEQSIHYSYIAMKTSNHLDSYNVFNIPYCFCQLGRYKEAYIAYNAALDYVAKWAKKLGLPGGNVSEHDELQEIADILTKQGYKVRTEVIPQTQTAKKSDGLDTFFEVVDIVGSAVKRHRDEQKLLEMMKGEEEKDKKKKKK